MNGPLVTIRRPCTLPSWPPEYTGCDVRKLPKPEVTLMDQVDQDHLMISRWIGKCLLIIFANQLKVVFIQKVLMPSSYLRKDKLNYFLKLEFWYFVIILPQIMSNNRSLSWTFKPLQVLRKFEPFEMTQFQNSSSGFFIYFGNNI